MMENKEENFELMVRIRMCRFIINLLLNDEEMKADPRQPDALKEYQSQLAELMTKQAAINNPPPDIVIGLKPAELFGDAK